MNPRLVSSFVASLLATAAVSAFPTTTHLYTPPTSEPYIEKSGESVVNVNDSSGSISTAQTAINNARTAHPSSILVITLTGTYTVSSTPLTLSSNECLVLASGTIIQASTTATAASLISVSGASNVSIAGGTLDAKGTNMCCINVATSNRVQIDGVTAQNAKLDGIAVAGNGSTSWDNELVVTRCTVSGGTSTHYGISFKNATQGIVIDNNCSNNAGGGIYIASCSHCTFANNTCNSNGIDGIHLASGDHNFISDNELDTNPTDIYLSTTSANNVIASNHAYYATTVGVNETGSGTDTFFENYYKGNTANFTSSGSGNHHLAYKSAISDAGDDYFYPPIVSNAHTTTTIVNGKGRTDVTIGSTTIDSVQSQYNSARTANPNNVIVLHLTGTTYTVGANPLTLSSNTCVLLTGTIQESSSSTVSVAVNATSGSSHISFSGGTIDGAGRANTAGLDFSGCSMVWVQGVTLQNYGVPTTRSGNGVLNLHAMSGPAMVSSCTINESGGRGIWTEGNGPFVITDNASHNNNMDGVDCDSTTANALVKFNDCSTNTRYGVFIEQAAQYDVAFGNICSAGLGRGVNIYNNGEPSSRTTQYNTAFCNQCDADSNALRSGSTGTGSDGTTTVTSHNFFFNNTATNSTGDGIESDVTGTQNYYSQTILSGNGTDTVTSGSEAFFNPPHA